MELTLVLAATRGMGIGRAGTLPWTGLKKEMAYFARITKRLPPGAPPTAINAVIMGRKTWDSIPPRFRPLKGRLNVVLSRSAPELPTTSDSAAAAANPKAESGGDRGDGDAPVVHARSLPEALAYLRAQQQQPRRPLGRVFVIGGAQVYDTAAALPETRRVLLTSILTEFDCDTAVSLRLGEEDDQGQSSGGGDQGGSAGAAPGRWRKASKEAHDVWAGEEVPEGVQEENGTLYEFQMWERVD